MKKLRTLLLLSMVALTVAFFSSCSSDDDDSSKFKDVTLTAGSSQMLNSGEDLTWKSENSFIAEVVNGEIKAYRVGETKVASNKGSFKIKVTPKYNYFEEPNINFGTSIKDVKKSMENYNLLLEDANSLTYEGTNYAKLIMYMFKNNALEISYILTKSSYSTQVAKWMNERYVYAATTDDYIGFVSVDKTTVILVTPTQFNNTWYYSIVYGKMEKESKSANSTLKKMPQKSNVDKFEYIIKDLSSKIK